MFDLTRPYLHRGLRPVDLPRCALNVVLTYQGVPAFVPCGTDKARADQVIAALGGTIAAEPPADARLLWFPDAAPEVPPSVPVAEVRLAQGEGTVQEVRDRQACLKGENAIAEAEELLSTWTSTAPEQGYNKTAVEVRWADGSLAKVRVDLERGVSPSLARILARRLKPEALARLQVRGA